jgi:acetyl esterase/lipase
LQARVGSALRLGSEIGILRHLYGTESWLISRIPKSDVFTEIVDADGVKVVIYRRLAWVAAEDEPEGPLKPCLIYLHGGGWVFCSAGTVNDFSVDFSVDFSNFCFVLFFNDFRQKNFEKT